MLFQIINNENNKKNSVMNDKKQNTFKSPDLSKLQLVVINHKTRIYVAEGDDPEEAKARYLARLEFKKP